MVSRHFLAARSRGSEPRCNELVLAPCGFSLLPFLQSSGRCDCVTGKSVSNYFHVKHEAKYERALPGLSKEDHGSDPRQKCRQSLHGQTIMRRIVSCADEEMKGAKRCFSRGLPFYLNMQIKGRDSKSKNEEPPAKEQDSCSCCVVYAVD